MIGMIAAVAPDGLIGCAGKIPWHYPLDLKFFKETTEGATVIMGRKTWDSLPPKFRPLPNRQNLVVSRSPRPMPWCESLQEALYHAGVLDTDVHAPDKDVWIIGGAEIYRLGMIVADQLVLTLVPDIVNIVYPSHSESPVYFPWISPKIWRDRIQEHPHDPRLSVARYWRKTP